MLAALCAAPPAANAQSTLEGRVIDTADVRLSNVTVELVGVATMLTDTLGIYRARGLAAQTLILRVRRLGYLATTRIVTLGAGETRREDFELAPAAAMLTPVVTTEHAGLLDPSGFERRRRTAIGGTFVTEDQITAIHATRTEQLFERAGHTHVGSGGVVGGPVVGASGSPLPPPVRLIRSNKCTAAAVFLDGTLVTENFDINSIPPSSIRGIEIYRGPATTPPELRSYATNCGTVAIWTK
jgi:hypothetical protein